MESYDVVIVGGGPAGITIANALSKMASVLLVDKCDRERKSFCDIPILAGEKIQKLKSVRQIKINDNHESIINESLGGNSEINGLVHYLGLQNLYEQRQQNSYANLLKYYEAAVSLSHINLKKSFGTKFDAKFLELNLGVDKGFVNYRTNRFLRSSYKLNSRVKFQAYEVKPSDIKNFIKNKLCINGQDVKFSNLVFCVSPCAFQLLRSPLGIQEVGKLYDHVNMRIRIPNPYKSLSLNRGIEGFMQKFAQVARFSVGVESLLTGVGPTSFQILEYGKTTKKYFKLQLLWFCLDNNKGRFQRGIGTDISISITPFNPYFESNFGQQTTELLTMEDIREIARSTQFFLESLDIFPVKQFDAFKYILGELMSSRGSGYHIIGGGALPHTDNKDMFKPVELNSFPGVYLSGALTMSEYFSSNIEAPIIAIAKAHADHILSNNI